MLNHKISLVFLFIILAIQSQGQTLLDTIALSQQKTLKSLAAATTQPDSVFKLDLSKQKHKVVPEEIRSFKNLQVLRLSRNKLTEIPEWIGELKNLQVLDLSYNNLKMLPDSIGNCTQLVHLGLNRNVIETLPHTIGRLEFLEVIELWDNEIISLPDEIKHLHNLKTLELRGILFSKEEQEQIFNLLPETNVFFSPSCNCKN
ncbi:MAG: leucine-rich repeat domain-containing protein [Bacteroidetes bacterium]|nr:leucine-rich repeat domain-containing protein [Bacteroidota bacterium]